MDAPNIVTLNLTGCKYLGEIHLRIREAFDFPEWYGQNWDAFGDLIREPRPYTIVGLNGFNSLPNELKPSGEMIISILQENKEYQQKIMDRNPQFDYRFEYRIID